MEPLRGLLADLRIVALEVVLTDRAQHDRRGDVFVEGPIDANQVVGHEAAQNEGSFPMALTHLVSIEHGAARSTEELAPGDEPDLDLA